MKKITDSKRLFSLGLAFFMSIGMPVTGYAEDREAFRAVFDAEYYYSNNPDLQETMGEDAEKLFSHFVSSGVREGRSGNGEFNLRAYIFNNKDLLDAYQTDLSAYCRHFLEKGRSEGRICLPQEGEEKLVGSYSTSYDPSLPRAVNVSLAAERIHGTILQPGQLFSFSSAVQPRIPENGYVLAPAIGGNEYGGGICQVSSTLYAAMCHAMIPAMERHPHSSRVSYLPAGLDATISEGYKDLKFINPYQKPLTILTDNRDGLLTVSLYLDREIREEAENAEAWVEGQQNEEQQNEGQQNEGQQNEGQQNEEQQNEGQQNEEQKNEEQKNEGQQNEGQQNEEQQNEGQQNEGQQNEEQQNEDQQNEERQGTGTETAGEMKEGPGNTKAAGTETPAGSEETSAEAEVSEGTEESAEA